MKQLYLRVEYRDGETTSFFEGYVFHFYCNRDKGTVKILNMAMEEDEFEGVIAVESGKDAPLYNIRIPLQPNAT